MSDETKQVTQATPAAPSEAAPAAAPAASAAPAATSAATSTATSTPYVRPEGGGPRREGGYRPREGGGSGPRREGSSGPRREGGPAGAGGRDPRKFFRRKKVCKFCVEKIDAVNYKDVRMLQQFVAPEGGKIVPRRITGVCSPHQRRVTEAIKQARNIALLPFASR